MPPDEEVDEPERDRRFLRLFGVSREELIRQGVDIHEYARSRSAAAVARVYQEEAERLGTGSSLLPYWAPSAWVGTGPTRLKGGLGSVEVTRTSVRVVDMTEAADELATETVSVRGVPIWLGLGVCLVAGDRKWYVQPWYSPSSPRRGFRANRVFRRALQEALSTPENR